MRRSRRSAWGVALGSVLMVAFVAGRAEAFSFETTVTDGCHERMTLTAIDEVGWPDGRTPPPVTRRDQLLASGLPGGHEGRDRWALSLLIGVRYPDLGSESATDTPALAVLHGDPMRQRAHCLRGRRDDGDEGNQSALAACRDYAMEEIELAFGEGEALDLDATEAVRLSLAFEGKTDVEVSRYAFHLGQALHAVQDSFSHTYRDETAVRHVLNFFEWSGSSYSRTRDGEPHDIALDQCKGSAAARARAERATRASVDLLTAMAEGPDALVRARAVLDRVLAYAPGCDRANDFCDAPERLESDCSVSAARHARLPMLVLVLLGLAIALRRAPRVAYVSLLLAIPATAFADDEPVPPIDAMGEISLVASVSASIDHGSFAYRAGARMRLSRLVAVGLELEHNPWFSIEVGNVVPGTINGFATVSLCWLRFRDIELQSTAMLGASVLLFSTYATDAGSVGPLLGASLLGVTFVLGPRLGLVFEPAEVVVPIPRIKGVPLVYRQYRATVGLRWTF